MGSQSGAPPKLSDLVVGWQGANCTLGCINDYWAVVEGPPTLDVSQNLVNATAINNGTYTMLEFDRSLTGFNFSEDRSISSNGINFFLYSMNIASMPYSVDLVFADYHGNNRGYYQLDLSLPSNCSVESSSSKSNPSGSYTNPDGTITVSWVITGNIITFDLTGKTTGWVAIGISNDAGMPNSDIALGWIDSSNNPFFFARNVGAVRAMPMLDNQQELTLISYLQTSTTTNFKWSRNLVIDDAGYISIINAPMYLIWAYCDTKGTSDNQFNQHLPTTRGVANVNFFTGVATTTDTTKIKIHALLMLASWGIFTVIAVFVARFGKLSFGTRWFPLHWGLNSMAILFTITAFCLIVTQRQEEGLAHFDGDHEACGLITVFLSLVQGFFGYLADKMFNPERKSIPIFPDKVHWWLGRFTALFALITIVLGLIKNGANLWGPGIFIAFMVCVIILFIIQQRYKGSVQHSDKPERKPGDRNICYILTALCLVMYIPVAISVFIF